MDHPLAYTQRGDGFVWIALAVLVAAVLFFKDAIVSQLDAWGVVQDADGDGTPDSIESVISRL